MCICIYRSPGYLFSCAICVVDIVVVGVAHYLFDESPPDAISVVFVCVLFLVDNSTLFIFLFHYMVLLTQHKNLIC